MGYLYTRRSLLMMVATAWAAMRAASGGRDDAADDAAIYQRDAKPMLADPRPSSNRSSGRAPRPAPLPRRDRLPEARRTTIVAACAGGNRHLAHVGDSRLYCCAWTDRPSHQRSLSVHTSLSPADPSEQAKTHPDRQQDLQLHRRLHHARVEIAPQIALHRAHPAAVQ